MNVNKESTTVEDMRKKLKNYCSDMDCRDCKLHSPVCRCGNKTHFMTKDNTGNYEIVVLDSLTEQIHGKDYIKSYLFITSITLST